MNDEKILAVITEIFVDDFENKLEDISKRSNIYEELGLDSLDSVDLIVALENKFNFKVNRVTDESTLREIRTIQDIMDYIKSKKQKLINI